MRRRIGCLLWAVLFCSMSAKAGIIFNDTQGHQTPLEGLKGKWVLINYWASWCKPCIDEIEELNAFYANKKNNVALFAVNFDALPLDEQQHLINTLHISYPSLLKDPGPALGFGYVRGVPATFVLDPEGHHVDTLYGGQTKETLEKYMVELKSHATRVL